MKFGRRVHHAWLRAWVRTHALALRTWWRHMATISFVAGVCTLVLVIEVLRAVAGLWR